MKQHKWHKEIKAWADGEDVEVRWTLDNGTWSDWKLIYDPYFCWLDKNEYRIKSQPKEEKEYWLCCGAFNYQQHHHTCCEAKVGHKERCRFGTAKEHSEWSNKEMLNGLTEEETNNTMSVKGLSQPDKHKSKDAIIDGLSFVAAYFYDGKLRNLAVVDACEKAINYELGKEQYKHSVIDEPKEPQYLYVHRNDEGDIKYAFGQYVSIVGYFYIGKIKLEDTE